MNIFQPIDFQYRKFVKSFKQYMKLSELFLYQACVNFVVAIILHQNENRF